MTRDEIEAFLAEPRNVMVAAIRKDGRPQMTPNWFYWDGSRFYISTTKTRRKYTNFKRDPRVQLVVDDSTGFRTVVLDGTVEIWEDLDKGLPYFKEIRKKHRGSVPDDATMRRGLQEEQRVLLVITPEKLPEQWTRWSR
jgi:PPOX class probable F420-dependent enzyme